MAHPSTPERGFTLIELVIVIAMISILATIAMGYQRAAVRNANLSGAAYDLALKLSGMRAGSMSDGTDHLLVMVDADGDGSGCGPFLNGPCASWFDLQSPTSAWTLDDFDVANPATNASFVSKEILPKGLRLDTASPPPALPIPFNADTVPIFDPNLTTTCGSRTCFAIRFDASGTVRPVFKSSVASSAKRAYCFGFGTDDATKAAAARKAVLVTFPIGLVKTFAY